MTDEPTAKINCPHCGGELHYDTVSRIMDRSRVSMKLYPHKGEMMQAHTVGGVITQMEKLQVAVAKEIGLKIILSVEKITTDADGAIKIDFLLARHEPGIKKR
jgi:hypothetical protein